LLRDCNFKISYNYEEDNIIEDFYVPALKNSIYYRRATGIFGPKSLARAVLGFSSFFFNKGKMKLLCSVLVNDEEFFEILHNYKEDIIPKFIEDKMLESLNEFQSKIMQNHLEVLAWLLKEGQLEIRFVLMLNKHYMYHKKIGIFKDEEGNIVSFYGSLNESIGGWDGNNETFLVFKNWVEGEEKFIRENIEEFERDWRLGRRKYSITYELNNAIKERILTLIGNKSKREIEDFIEHRRVELGKKTTKKGIMKKEEITQFNPFSSIKWKKPQIEGYQNWIENNRRGILSIATGVGKTLIGIRALYDFTIAKLKENKKPVVVIGVHSTPMIKQWKDEILEWLDVPELDEKFKIITTIHGEKKETIDQQIANLNMKWEWYKNFIIITRFDTLCNKLVHFLTNKTSEEILFIADEVHELGSEVRRERISSFKPSACLGLSATPERYFDEEGTKFLLDYFNGVIYEYEIKHAISDGYLCEYDYKPIFCNLNKEEEELYNKLTVAYTVETNKEDADPSKIQKILERRAKIIKKAESKFNTIIEVVNKLKEKEGRVRHMLIYLEEKDQIDIVKNDLITNDIIPAIITQDQPKDKKKRYEIIEQLRFGRVPIILAIRILDQGINIPELKYAILGASTGNEKQYIQRRGRILRTKKNKNKATIFDIIIPISNSEIKRAKIFYNDCSNKSEVRKIFKEKNIEVDN